MTDQSAHIRQALEVFVRGFSAEKSRTWPYEFERVGDAWVMRDAPRKNPRDYRKEEWVAYGVPPREVDAAARKMTRGRFFVCAVRSMDESEELLRADYKELGYRLLSTEPLFVHRLKKIPRVAIARKNTAGQASSGTQQVAIERVSTPEMAASFGKATRTRPIPAEKLAKDAPFRQYVA